MKKEIWIEKYRPKTFDEIIGLEKNQIKLIKKNLPHLMLIGPPGTGKTTLARVIIKDGKYDALMLNASDERGIDVIRKKVKSFCSTMSINGTFKVVFLDEADKLTADAQDSLRNIMETYVDTCRFILTGNKYNKFDPALQSRCLQMKFDNPKSDYCRMLLDTICTLERVSFTDKDIRTLVEKYHPDIRSMINALQKYSASGTLESIPDPKTSVNAYLKLVRSKKYTDTIKYLYEMKIEHDDLLRAVVDKIMKSKKLSTKNKLKILKEAAEAEFRMAFVPDKTLQFNRFTVLLMKHLEG